MSEDRKPIISGNWKMNLNHFEAIALVQQLFYLLEEQDFAEVDVSIHPPFTCLRSVQVLLDDSKKSAISLGAQNCHWENSGAFTGEVSPSMLKSLLVSHVLVGHSERRPHEDPDITKKLQAVWKHEMTPILAVGETLEERDAGETESKISRQLQEALDGSSAAQIKNLVVAYEPIWAIGTGKTALPEQAAEVCSFIREWLTKNTSKSTAETTRIQYGGSVSPSNIADLMKCQDIDGALVGGSSLDADAFARIVRYRLEI